MSIGWLAATRLHPDFPLYPKSIDNVYIRRMTVGRNERCPCGSGKKYKVCCAATSNIESPQLLAWRRLRRAVEDHAPKLLGFITESYGPGAVKEAWEEFTLWSDEPFTPESPQVALFFPWLFHIWSPDPAETGIEARCLHSVPPTQAYLIARGRGMDATLYRYLSACLDSPFGFYEVIAVDPGHGMQMREVFTETTCQVLERSATGSLRMGDIVYGMVVECDGVAMLEATAPFAFPLRFKPAIIDERELLLEDEAREREEMLEALAQAKAEAEDSGHDAGDLRDEVDEKIDSDDATVEARATLTRYALSRHDFPLREVYWELLTSLLNPRPPQLHNTDGDALSMQKLIFAVDSAAAAFAALKGLAIEQSDEELLRGAQYAADDALRRVEFGWTKAGNSRYQGLQSTLLGHIEIDGTQLTAEVNSAKRATQFKSLVREKLGDKARYRMTEIQSMDRLMTEVRTGANKASSQADLDQAALMARPEVQAKLREVMAQHYAGWVDEKLPALKGKTPREAVRTAAGQEKVDALIRDIERMGPGTGGYDVSIVKSLRERLGL